VDRLQLFAFAVVLGCLVAFLVRRRAPSLVDQLNAMVATPDCVSEIPAQLLRTKA
jgi:hypothetical protein